MSDVRFEVDFVPKTASAYACRYAVLSKILSTGRKFTIFRSTLETTEATFKVLYLWRRRLAQLRELESPLVEGRRFQYLRNCEPSITAMKPSFAGGHAQTCNSRDFCPWCWCRGRIHASFERLKAGLASLGSSWEAGRQDYPVKVASVTDTLTITDMLPVTSLFSFAEDGVTQMLRSVQGVAQGAITIQTVFPYRAGYRIRMGLLAILPADQPVQPKVKVAMTPSNKNLAMLLSSMFAYPRGLLLGDPGLVADILAARKNRKLFRSFGILAAHPIS